MAGYVTIEATDISLRRSKLQAPKPKRAGDWTVRVTVTAYDDFKGTVSLTYACESTGSPQPDLDNSEDYVWLDARPTGEDSTFRDVEVYQGGGTHTFLCEADAGSGEGDSHEIPLT